MKKILIIALLTLTTSACVNLQFDALEYDRYVTISELATSATPLCGTPEVVDRINVLKKITNHQYVYSSNRTSRPQVAEATKNLKEIVDPLYVKFQQHTPPSEWYCKQKLKNVSAGALLVIRTLGDL